MTKKHFVALADTIRNCKPNINAKTGGPNDWYLSGREGQWETMRDAMADFCQSQNSQFNRKRWLAYIAGECGPNGGKL